MIRPIGLPTTSVDQRPWDAVVIGAGPAGAIAARRIAIAGQSVLLVDKNRLPREKVCGACVNGAAMEVLERLGLRGPVDGLRATPLRAIELSHPPDSLTIGLTSGCVIRRSVLDRLLVSQAVAAGATYLAERTASVLPRDQDADCRGVELATTIDRQVVRAKIIVVADGLGRNSLRRSELGSSRIPDGSRIGVGRTLPVCPDTFPTGVIRMAIGQGGYVGLVRVPGNRINVAAALDRRHIAMAGSVAGAVRHLLKNTTWSLPEEVWAGPDWKGTVSMTSFPSRVSGWRVLAAGDAAGYVEPFTGEGIAWAIESGHLAGDLAAGAIDHWTPQIARQWETTHRRVIRRRQRWCRLVATLLRHPRMVRSALALLHWHPILAVRILDRLNQPPPSIGASAAPTSSLPRHAPPPTRTVVREL